MTNYLVCDDDDIPEGGRKVVLCGDREIGIFRIKGQLHAWHNSCPHRQGPICQGHLYSRVIEPVDANGHVRLLQYDDTQPHIVCPWHGYEFNLETGQTVASDRLRLRRARVEVRDGVIHVTP